MRRGREQNESENKALVCAFLGNDSFAKEFFELCFHSLDDTAFMDCEGLVSVAIPSGVTEINISAFRWGHLYFLEKQIRK